MGPNEALKSLRRVVSRPDVRPVRQCKAAGIWGPSGTPYFVPQPKYVGTGIIRSEGKTTEGCVKLLARSFASLHSTAIRGWLILRI